MQTIIDPSVPPEWGRRRRNLILIVALLFVVFILGRIVLSNWVDLLWFSSLGYGSVFWTTIYFRWFSSLSPPWLHLQFCIWLSGESGELMRAIYPRLTQSSSGDSRSGSL